MNIYISAPLQGQPKIMSGVSKCPPMRNIGINISYIFDFTKVSRKSMSEFQNVRRCVTLE